MEIFLFLLSAVTNLFKVFKPSELQWNLNITLHSRLKRYPGYSAIFLRFRHFILVL